MKKLLFIVVALVAALSVNAQNENKELVPLLKVNFEGVTPSYTPTGDNIMKVESTDEGLALINPIDFDTRWWGSEMVLTDDCLTLQKRHNYIVRLTMKVPHKRENALIDMISYTVRAGNWKNWNQNVVTLSGGDDFQVVDFEIPKFPYDIEGDGHIVIKHQFVTGITTVLKELEVFEEIIPESPVADETKLICEKNLEGIEPGFFWEGEKPDWYIDGTDEGLAIINPTLKDYMWFPHAGLAADFDLEKNHNYIVRLTMKVPSDGTYTVRMGGGDDVFKQYEVPVTGGNDWQVIDVNFSDFGGDVGHEIENLIMDCRVELSCGWVVGTTVVKKVEVFEVLGSGVRGGDKTAINAVKAMNADGAIYNLAGQKVDASYKGIVIQNGKKRIAR